MEIPALSRESGENLSRQILDWFRGAILDGSLGSGETLPATRELARQLGVSRNTVCEAYELLAAEGYIDSSSGTKSRVAPGIPLPGAPEDCRRDASAAAATPEVRSRRRWTADFRTGRPDRSSIPRAEWRSALRRAVSRAADRDWLYGSPDGIIALRREIAAYLFRVRGMRVSPESVFVSAGATHALHVVALVLRNRGRSVAVEDPCHTGMARTLGGVGAAIVPVQADGSGMIVSALSGIDAGAAYVTPSHQFPLGGILPASRRTELILWARSRDAYIIEDDYDAEFRYSGPPVAPLWTLDPERTVYIGTFSKSLFPAIRIGYALVPGALRDDWRAARIHSDVQNPPFEQAALAELLANRTADRHVARMRRLYARRRTILLRAIDRRFGGRAEILGDAAGLHLAMRLRGCRIDEAAENSARERGIVIVGAERHALVPGRWTDTLILGYGHLSEPEIDRGIDLLADFLSAP